MEKTVSETIISQNIFGELASPYARRRFFWSFFAILFVLVLCLAAALHWLEEGAIRTILVALLSSTAANIVAILLFYGFYQYFLGGKKSVHGVVAVRAKDISAIAQKLPIGTSHYLFWGRSGSFFRAFSIKKLDAESRLKNRAVEVTVILPNPTIQALRRKYAEILASLDEASDEEALTANVLATYIICATIESNSSQLSISVYLSDSLPGYRIDMSDKGLLLTQDAKSKPALFFEADSDYFDMFRSIGLHERSVAKKVVFDSGAFRTSKDPADHVTRENFKTILGETTIDDSLVERVKKIIEVREHRYK